MRLGILQQNFQTKVMATQKERKALRNSTSKDPKETFSPKKIVHHPMKTMIVKNKPMREYFLWPSTIRKRYQTMKKKDGP